MANQSPLVCQRLQHQQFRCDKRDRCDKKTSRHAGTLRQLVNSNKLSVTTAIHMPLRQASMSATLPPGAYQRTAAEQLLVPAGGQLAVGCHVNSGSPGMCL